MSIIHSTPVYLAVDFGAGSGRVMACWVSHGIFELEEVHRFPNDGVNLNGTWHWNIIQQFTHILEGLKKAGDIYGDRISSIGIDTWGVDYGLLDASGSLLGIPVQYRDSRHDGQMEKAYSILPKEEIYQHTGNQLLAFNTLFQLLAEKEQNPGRLQSADRILLIPDLFNFWLTGVATNESTNASTMQLVDAATGEWAWDLIDRMGLPRKLFQEITPPGTVLGPLLPEMQAATGLSEVQVVTVGSHDTASAYTGIPLIEDHDTSKTDVYLSSGTWSLLGAVTPEAVITEQSFALSFTNERATNGEIRLLKNHCGMWLMQECKRVWDQEKEVSWEELIREAEAAEPFVSFINPDDERFAKRCDMPQQILDACKATGQPVPESRGALSRMIYESLALTYRCSFDQLSELVGGNLGTLHVVGGGSRNKLLNQFTANAIGHQVMAGPIEATAMGNVLSQMTADGSLPDLESGQALILKSFMVDTFEPENTDEWENVLERFRKVLG
jgi:rhamnulokinase